ELLLLPGGAAPPGVPVVVLRARTRRRRARARGALPGVSANVGERRLARARRAAVPQRPRGRRRRAHVRGRRLLDARGIPRRALVVGVRRTPARPRIAHPGRGLGPCDGRTPQRIRGELMRTNGLYDSTRGLTLLLAAGVAGLLLYLATEVGQQTTIRFWESMGLVAARAPR